MYTSLRKGNIIYDGGNELLLLLLLIDGEGEASKEVRSRHQEVDRYKITHVLSLFYLIALVLARSCLIKVSKY